MPDTLPISRLLSKRTPPSRQHTRATDRKHWRWCRPSLDLAAAAPNSLRPSDSPRPGKAREWVEHQLAHLVRRQGRRAPYRGVRKNLFDVRRAAALQDLETIQVRSRNEIMRSLSNQ